VTATHSKNCGMYDLHDEEHGNEHDGNSNNKVVSDQADVVLMLITASMMRLQNMSAVRSRTIMPKS